jgi:hypothetical protein
LWQKYALEELDLLVPSYKLLYEGNAVKLEGNDVFVIDCAELIADLWTRII